MTLRLSSPLTEVWGVGPKGAGSLRRGGLETVGDLLLWLPHRYEDRSSVRSIASLTSSEPGVTLVGELTRLSERRARNRRMRIVSGAVDDGTGSLAVVWFNQPYLTRSLAVGARVWLYGALRPARGGGGLELVNSEWEVEDADEIPVHLGRIVPMYRRVESWNGRRLRATVAHALAGLEPFSDPVVGQQQLTEHQLPGLLDALRSVHFPVPPDDEGALAEMLGALARRSSPAHRRLALDELLSLALVVERSRAARRRQRAVACTVTGEIREQARSVLPFRLTPAQRRVLAEIVGDLQRPFPMARLLQGDVGAGKTIVAALAALVVLASGSQVALLAPTELLAQQHHATLGRLLGSTPYRPQLLIGSLSAAGKREIRDRLTHACGSLVIGTHALLQDEVVFRRLALVIIDEQHRFGVAQRQALLDKGVAPHLLVMTATPIPRSLALSLYGDLDVSVLDELPPGRTPIRTVLRDDTVRPQVAAFLRRQVAAGGQVYWVVPLVDESKKVVLRALTTHIDAVQRLLPGVRVGVVHGRLAAAEREATMASFVDGEVQVLCATTVIEVGVDVANASVMVVENADRFGLAQLHQLRGRVGRGARRSFCILLVGSGCTEDARRRLELFASTCDGFRIAEEDFRARGPGEISGLRQWGRSELRIANLATHLPELTLARAIAAGATARGELEQLGQALMGSREDGSRVRSG